MYTYDASLPIVLWRVFPKIKRTFFYGNHSKTHIDTMVLANLETFLFRFLEFLSSPVLAGVLPEAEPRWGLKGRSGWKTIP